MLQPNKKVKKKEINNVTQQAIDLASHRMGSKLGIGSAVAVAQSVGEKKKPNPSDVLGMIPGGVTQALSLVSLQAEKEKENIKKFQENKNRVKKLKPKEKPLNIKSKESTSVKNTRDFIK